MGFFSSAQRKARRVAALSGPERSTLIQAALLLPLVAVGRRLLSFKRLQALLGRAVPLANGRMSEEASAVHTAQQIARVVQSAGYVGPFRANCLERSLVLWALLRRAGIPGDLRIGVRKEGERFDAHAWVEYQNVVLNDAGDVGERYAPLVDLPDTLGHLSP